MTERPLLFLDVDGVLNPYGYAHPPCGFEVLHTAAADGEPVLLRREHGAWIRELAEEFDIVWATAWNDRANKVVAPYLEIARLAVVAMPSAPFPPDAKVDRIDAFAGRRPLTWVDDQHGAARHDWVLRRSASTLLISVDPTVGLTRCAVNEALTWVTAASGGRS